MNVSEFPKLGPISSKLGWLISLGESHGNQGKPNYNVANSKVGTGKFTLDRTGHKREVFRFPINTNAGITNRTVAEVRAQQKAGAGNLWAVGRWQITREPMKEFITYFKLKGTEIMDEHLQDLYVVYAIAAKRKALRDYIVNGTGTLEAAALALAQEWSSKAVASGKSYYASNRIDKAHVTYENVLEALQAGRAAYMKAARLYAGRDARYILWMSLHDNARLIPSKNEYFNKYPEGKSPAANRVVTIPNCGMLKTVAPRSAESVAIKGTLIITPDGTRFRDEGGRIYNIGGK